MIEKISNETLVFSEIFQAAPDPYLVLTPAFVIISANNAFLEATHTEASSLNGKYIFDALFNHTDIIAELSYEHLKESFHFVLENKTKHTVAPQFYDYFTSDRQTLREQWQVLNTPVCNKVGEIIAIIHKIEKSPPSIAKPSVQLDDKRGTQLTGDQENEHWEMPEGQSNRFKALFEYSPVMKLISTLQDGRIMMVNRAFEDFFGANRVSLINKTVIELNLTTRERRNEIVNEAIQNGGVLKEFVTELNIVGGSKRYLLASAEIVEIDGAAMLLSAMVDITRRTEMERELKQTNHFLDSVLDNIPHMVFVKDATDLGLLKVNNCVTKITGCAADAMMGQRYLDLFPEDQRAFFTQKDREALETGQVLDIEEEPVSTINGIRWMHTKKIPVFENGIAKYLIGISEDVTEKKQQTDAILSLNKELEAFTYSVSHDLRAPLRAISGYAEILRLDYSDKIDEEGKRLLSRVSKNAMKMGQLIDDLLTFSRLGRKELKKGSVNMQAIVEEAMRNLQKTIPSKTRICVDSLHPCIADSNLMAQVVYNLLDNAIKYSSKKDNPVVEISSKELGNDIVYEISDNGSGFDMRYVDKLFNVFQRLHSTEEFEGTGVGLAIVQLIVNKHGGKIWANGVVNIGASFYISLPKMY